VIYYVYAYLELVKEKRIEFNDLIDVTVPTGNFGNIYSAYIAKELGVPIRNLVIASNTNNVLTDLFNSYEYNINRELKKTISPSMDILISSNFERYLYHLYKGDYSRVREEMSSLKANKTIKLDVLRNQTDFYAFFADERKTKETIKDTFTKDKYLIDPHTGVAKSCFEEYKKVVSDETYMLVVSTASPYKFTDALLEIFALDTNEDIKQKFSILSKYTKTKIDERMNRVLDVIVDNKTISLDIALETVKRIVGEIDASN
jgi:threonine synthase